MTIHFYSRNYINRTFNCLKIIDNSGNFAILFFLITKKWSLYADIIKKNIRYSKFLQNTKFEKLIKNIQKKSNNNKEKNLLYKYG